MSASLVMVVENGKGGTLDWDREILSLPFSCFIT